MKVVTKGAGRRLAIVLVALCLMLSSAVASMYLAIEPAFLVQLVLFGAGCLSLYELSSHGIPGRKSVVAWIVFSAAFALCIVLGAHISIEGHTYIGLVDENTIKPYSAFDVVSFVVIAAHLFLMTSASHAFLDRKLKRSGKRKSIDMSPILARDVVVTAIAVFAVFLPYLLVYYPGFIFADTLSSFNQLVTKTFNNHHPVFFTLVIGACWKVTSLAGFGKTAGCVLFSLLQMSVMSLCISYFANWLRCRLGLRFCIGVIIALAVAGTPYVATYSIAFWKDPVFSCLLMVISVLAFDYVFTKGAVASSVRWLAMFTALMVLMCLLRSNGIYISALMVLVLLVDLVIHRVRPLQNADRALGSVFAATVLAFAITGPLYGAMGVEKPSEAEAKGIFLNQMARVVAVGGEMNSEEKEYLNSIFPIDQYAEVYVPTCTDNLKWAKGFSADALKDPRFFKVWASLLVKNPSIYLESWELETFGFWAVNTIANDFHTNIAGGVPRNTAEGHEDDLSNRGISSGNLLGSDFFRSLFPQDGRCVPVGWVTWLVIWLTVLLCLQGRPRWIIALVPSIGLLGTLIVASPIWYWPRYGFAVQLLIPFYLFAAYNALSNVDQTKGTL